MSIGPGPCDVMCADLQRWGRSSVVVASLRMMSLSCSTWWWSPWLHCSLLCWMLWVVDSAAELPLSRWVRWLSWWSLGWWPCSPFHIYWPQTPMMQGLLQNDVLQKMASGVWWGSRCFLSQLKKRTFDGFASMSQSRWCWCPFVGKLLLLLRWLLKLRWTGILLPVLPIVVLLLLMLLHLLGVDLWLFVVMLLLGLADLGMLHWWTLHMLWIDTSILQIGSSCRRMLVGVFCTDALSSLVPPAIVAAAVVVLVDIYLTSWCLFAVVTLGSPWWSFQGPLLRYHVKTQSWCATDAGSWLLRALMMCLWYTLHDVHEEVYMRMHVFF